MSDIPNGWAWTHLSKIALLSMGQSPDGQFTNSEQNGIPLVGGAAEFKGEKIVISRYTAKPTKISQVGDILLCIRATIGKVAFSDQEYCLGRGVAGIRSYVNNQWLFLKLKQSAKALDQAGTGSTFRQVDKRTLEDWPILLPPLEEQLLIVNKVAALTLQIESCRELLTSAEALCKKFKLQVLNTAFRSHELSLTEIETTTRKTIGDIITGIKSGKNLKCEERPPRENEKGVLKVSAVTWGEFNPLMSKTLPQEYVPHESLLVSNGDFLISRANTLELVGAPVIVGSAPGNLYLSDKIWRLEMGDRDKSWLMWFLRSPDGRSAIERIASGTQLSMRNISQDSLKAIDVPWPSDQTRESVVQYIEKCMSAIKTTENHISHAFENLVSLEASILEYAMSGRLVDAAEYSQSAENLLNSIRDQRSKVSSKSMREIIKVEIEKMAKSLKDVLSETEDWILADDAFQKCGIHRGSTTEELEPVYSELRMLDQAGLIISKPKFGPDGKKVSDLLKLVKS